MARPWIVFCFLTVVTSDSGFMGRSGDARDYLSPPRTAEEPYKGNPRLHTLKRWRRDATETTHRERCAELAAPWMETTEPPADTATLLRLRVRSFEPRASRRMVFPGKPLFNFVRRVYRCCQEGLLCRNVKGIQGHLSEGTHAEFILTPNVFSVAVMRAELHLQLFNPQHLSIQPVLLPMAKHNLPTRYNLWSRGDTVELRVDLRSLFQGPWETAGGATGDTGLVNVLRSGALSRGGPREVPAPPSLQDTDGDVWGEGQSPRPPPPLEVGLALSCSQAGRGLPCEHAGLRFSHTPFLALSYR